MPNLDTLQGAQQYASEWDDYTSQIGAALQASSGLEREKLAAQLKDAQAGRANAYKIAQLQAQTSKYGIDAQRQTAMAQLKENARQFDLNHALDYAKTATDYLSTPDRFAQGIDFQRMAGRALSGAGGPEPYGTGVSFQPKTEADFAALASGSAGSVGAGWSPARTVAPPAAPALVTTPAGGTASPTPGGSSAPTDPRLSIQPVREGVPGGAAPSGPAPTGNEQSPVDPRVKALKSIIDAMPPSATPGHDNNDLAVMNAATALYSTNLRPGTLEAMRPDQRAIYSSFVKRSGRSWNDYLSDYERSAPGQSSVRRA